MRNIVYHVSTLPREEFSMRLITAMALCSLLLACTHTSTPEHTNESAASLRDVLAGEHRNDSARARDQYRHPEETLRFFELSPTDTVVELFPGGGWYTDIIAPFVAENGQYYGAGYALDIPDQPEYRYKLTRGFSKKISDRALYGNAQMTSLAPPTHTEIAPPGSADLVVTFRNFHGWLRSDPAPYLAAVVAALKPGGIFGVVQHRANPGASLESMQKSGYVAEQTVIDLAAAAGLQLLDRADINANPQDTKNHPMGVWTLPPSLRLGEQDREKYLAIGESDRMTLKFIKPE